MVQFTLLALFGGFIWNMFALVDKIEKDEDSGKEFTLMMLFLMLTIMGFAAFATLH